MVTVAWNPDEFHIINVLPNGVMSCSTCHLSHIMDLLLSALQPDKQHPFQKLVIHADNAASRQDRRMKVSKATASGARIILGIHGIWQLHISL
jgi:hypothetical protein